MTDRATVMSILDLARWAPSGDNTQPWRFEIVSSDHVVVHGFDTREHCVYDLDGRASQLAIGALLETLRIAATGHGLRAEIARRAGYPDTHPTFDVRLVRDDRIVPSELIPYIKTRCVQRRALSTRVLTAEEKAALEASVEDDHEIFWLEGWSNRFAVARLAWANAKIRLTIPEAYEVHCRIIEWGAQFSDDRIPDQALGLDPLAVRLTRWLLGDWHRVEFFNSYLAGTIYPRLTLDLIPSLRCGAHFLLCAKNRGGNDVDENVGAGASVQRVWLTATRLGLQQQPEMTPLIFARYAREEQRFTVSRRAQSRAARLATIFEAIVGQERAASAVWLARIGAGRSAQARSLRLPLHRLIVSQSQ